MGPMGVSPVGIFGVRERVRALKRDPAVVGLPQPKLYPLPRRASNAPFVERMDRIASIDIIAAEIVKVIAAKTNGNISLFVRIARKH